MPAIYALAEAPLAGDVNQHETLTPDPASPYNLTVGVAITPIDLDVEDPDSTAIALSQIFGSLPPGLSYSQVLPYIAPAPYTVQITGTPTTPGAYIVILRADDGIDSPDDKTLNFNVVSPMAGGGPGENIIGANRVDVARGFRRARFRTKV